MIYVEQFKNKNKNKNNLKKKFLFKRLDCFLNSSILSLLNKYFCLNVFIFIYLDVYLLSIVTS